MRTLYDIQQVLKRFGIFVYLGQRLYDIELMEIEFKKLYEAGLIEDKLFKSGILVLKREHRLEEERQNKEEM
ncbi:YqgQ family protein [Enterococcus nangangensis]|uniref:YqgQ family protein n=1 Tax=Enterococcus nangangensis TaxID=2559926 RepID=UPI0010FA4787|nr:YqgQ family protein [Enterococcus nangangensis]